MLRILRSIAYVFDLRLLLFEFVLVCYLHESILLHCTNLTNHEHAVSNGQEKEQKK